MILFKIVNKLISIIKKIEKIFWNWYAIQYCKCVGATLADPKSVIFKGRTFLAINPNSKVYIGKDFVLNSGKGYGIETGASNIYVENNAELYIGENVGMSSVVIGCQEKIIIGNNVNVGGGGILMDTNFHSLDPYLRADRQNDYKGIKTAPINIGNNVFIGARSIISKGVSIGENTIVATGSVVIKSLPANCIAGGNPCKVIKQIETWQNH